MKNGTIINQYKILSPIGKGGMGEVFLAQDTRLDRKAALKILPPEFAGNSERMSRFVREAKAASALNHPNIITIYEIGEENGTYFIATEFIEGETLHSRLQRNPLSLKSVLDIAVQIVSALQAAHSAGIVHRDIKPENVMIRADGLVKILDFGIAKLSADLGFVNSDFGLRNEEAETLMQSPPNNPQSEIPNPQSTSPGMIIGTANYMSPEQAKGKEIDARSDIFSFGIVLYEMLSGKRAFDGETPLEIISSILKDEPKPIHQLLPALPREIERIVNKTLRKDRDERYQTARGLLTDLKDAKQELEFQDKLERTSPPAPHAEEAKTQMITAPTSDEPQLPTPSTEFMTGEIKKHKLGVALASLIVLALVGTGVWLFFNRAAAGSKQIESIAVMPFVNESGNAETEYLSDGMTETLIRSLSQLPNLNVKPRSSVFRYKGKDTDLQTIGKELNVQAILNGRVVQRGDQLTLNLELIDARTENLIWTDEYDRKSSELVSLQNVIARDVSSKLKIRLSGADLEKLAKNYTTDPEAYRLYLQGRFYWNKRAGKEFERAEGYFQQAVARDPNFALGYIGLADFQEDQDRPRKKEYIRRALEIDDRLAEGHASLGYQYMIDYNWAESERELKRAIELNPKYPQAHQWNGARLMMNGKFDEARPELTRALELDPTSPGINLYYGVLLEVSGRIDESIQQYKKLLEMEPTFSWTHAQLARAYRRNGNQEGCVEERARGFELTGREDLAKAAREGFAKGGWKGFLRENPFGASSLAELGEYEKAIEAVVKQPEREGGGRFWFFLNRTDPFLDPIRDDPRFKEAIKKLDPPQ